MSKETDASDEPRKMQKWLEAKRGVNPQSPSTRRAEGGGQGLSWSGSYTLALNRRFSTRGGRPCQPTLDALIGILYKDVHDFAVWFHEDHDELMADMQEQTAIRQRKRC